MKKFFIILILLLCISPVFAKTVQCVKSYKVWDNKSYTVNDVTPQIQSMINQGWKVVSITPITRANTHASPTEYVIVIFEKEE